ncbi:DNA-binding CsgD family transcriptional regulator [Sphingomonas sp. SORGH_AS 950]|uniref:helix-turn-helix domain-containing protein n=1 Tax=Sphingomonas sp. SORGH_AS_0950 TaxID=3041792 RepID=UPI002783B331|nr:helix-turn-helix transcriptional regulator [Sphingomonas sp. SORGH_AS_0950]MDQ1158697.1 DNA-binding CsgD family transcriptional regulator [Sphingomonas sp. SORGH_AS_0950]
MTPERFALLTRRHRECLRGVKALKGSKEIAAELGLGKSTVDSYLTEAVRLLGARNRRDAAIALADFEAHENGQVPEIEAEPTPHKIIPDSAGLVSEPTPMPLPMAPDGSTVGGAVQGGHVHASPRLSLPVRRQGQARNDMTMAERLLWIPTIAVALAIGFGMLATGLDVMTRVIGRLSHLG